MPKPFPIGPFPNGMDNRSDETSLYKGTARKLRNLDVDNRGHLERRRSYQQLISAKEMHSLYSNEANQLFGCVGNILGIFDLSALSFAPLVDMPSKFRTAFTELNNVTYAFNPDFSCRMPNGKTTVFTVGVPLIDTTPAMFAPLPTGGLRAGKYTVALSVIDAAGEESGMSPEYTLDIEEGGGISVMGLPLITGNSLRLYCTTRDGEELYQVREVPMTEVSFTVGASHVSRPGRQPETAHKEPLPFGHFVESMGSRLLVAADNVLHFSSTFRPHLSDRRHDFITLENTIHLLKVTEGGVYLGDISGVYYLAGWDPAEWNLKKVSNQAPVYGSGLLVDHEDFSEELDQGDSNVLWLSRSGVQVGSPDGKVTSMHPHQLDLPKYQIAAAAFTQYNGMKQAIFPVNSNSWLGTGTAVESVIN